MGVCKIFGAGERVPESRIGKPENGDLVIAADGGYAWLCALAASEKAFLPKLFIGDFDSADAVLDSPEGTESEPLEEAAQKAREAVVRSCERTGTAVIELPIVKDDTDTGVCVREGLARGYRIFEIYGGTGGRWDHTLANCQLLTHIAREGGRGYLVGPTLTAFALHEGSVRIRGVKGATVSAFSAGGVVSGVTITGAKYEVNEASLADDYALGVSNSFTAEETVFSCKKGTLLIVGEFLPKDCD